MTKYRWKRIWARKFAPLLSSSFMLALGKNPGLDLAKNKLFIPEGNLQAMYFEESEFNRIVERYSELLLEQDMQKYAVWYEAQFDNFLSWSRDVTSQDFSAKTKGELSAILLELHERLVDFAEYQFYAFLVLEGLAKKVEGKLAHTPEILQAITTPYKHIRITQARIELLEMVRDGRVSEADLASYLEKYAWLPVYDFTDKPLQRDDLLKQIETIKDPVQELESLAHHQSDGLKAYNEFLETVDDENFRKEVEVVHHFSYLKEMRDDYRRHAYYLWLPFWNEIAQRIGLKVGLVNYLIFQEINEALMNGTDYSAVAGERTERYALWLKDGNLSVLAGDRVDEVVDMVDTDDVSSEIKGVSACRGKVTATARIIYHQGEFAKFQDGDVLVTTMTHPEFLVLMKKAVAIVTDEGGITCHAAIVSRELKKPCIIGTKIATKVLKDGDMVEVDAEKGIVRVLS